MGRDTSERVKEEKMKLSAIFSVSQAAVTSFIAKDGNEYDITPGCPEIWPQNTDPNTFLPPWTRECPPLDLCFTNTAYNRQMLPMRDARIPMETRPILNLAARMDIRNFLSATVPVRPVTQQTWTASRKSSTFANVRRKRAATGNFREMISLI